MARVAKELPASGAPRAASRGTRGKAAAVVVTDKIIEVAPPQNSALRQESALKFDRVWYEQQYPDVVQAGIDPATHYREFGWSENRWPNPHFSPFAYRAANPDLASYEGDLFLHYVFYGAAEGRPLG